ncbi:2'-5' RNA ligase family protein [Rossellomorea aquimaris]|uniref:2'-5' RNA ligase family protein n=1 Tax=Rossellomorea aquimaris TaxID=189382 RepID=UPI001CD4881F|nr:2'-5' RNA ligase family protein [Rossellomorea aquimaris]MCA1057687.1 2'-5' RNA ligase family protein [Rossellomorea aquimaris]
MKFFIGIIPPEEYKDRISAFRNRWKNNRIDQIVEPHITLKAQGGLTENLKWISRIKEVCSETEPFRIELNKAMFFGEEILYLSALSEDLHKLHEKIVNSVEPSKVIEKYFELDHFVPHLTLGKTTYGLTKQDLKDMAAVVETEIGPYPVLDVNFIRIYREMEQNKYVKFDDLYLGDKI